MKKLILLLLLFKFSIGKTQSLPIDFETAVGTADFKDFDGGTASVIDNPQPNGINTSKKVAQIVRNGGAIWAGSKIKLSQNLNFSTASILSMKVFTTAPVGTVVKFKLEGAGATERDVKTTVANQWEILTWDFTGEPAKFNEIVFMFDFGNVGNGSATSTFLFDEVEQVFGGTQLDLPVDFEGANVNYTMSDFGGNVSNLEKDPENPANRVIKVVKTAQAATWAGTTIGTPAGFATYIPLTLTASKMNVRVWSPAAGTPIRLKVEDDEDPTHTCETETKTTVAGGWETLEFNFLNQAPGTELLSVGLSMGWKYNMASIFFNFGTEGAAAGEKTYFFDDVKFGKASVGTAETEWNDLKIFPNPTQNRWFVQSEKSKITSLEIFDPQGKRLLVLHPDQSFFEVDASFLPSGVYFSKISSAAGVRVVRLLVRLN